MIQIGEIIYDVVFGFLCDNLTKVRDSGLSRERESSLNLLVFQMNLDTVEETVPIGFDVDNPNKILVRKSVLEKTRCVWFGF